jgi:hypothetical protein
LPNRNHIPLGCTSSCETCTRNTRQCHGLGHKDEEGERRNRRNKGLEEEGLTSRASQRCDGGGTSAGRKKQPSAWPEKKGRGSLPFEAMGAGRFMNTRSELSPFGTKARKGRAGVKVAQQTRYYSM